MNTARRAVFIDKDGTLITDLPYNADPEKIAFSPNCLIGLQQLQRQGYRLVIITNQSGIAMGYFSAQALIAVEARIKTMLAAAGIRLDGFYFCPHHPKGTDPLYATVCNCRKPQPGLLLKAARELGIDLAESWMIGDILNDVEAGNRAGCKSILIENGNETEWLRGDFRRPIAQAKNINEAAEFILNKDGE
ncbi:HAD family hydrolase [Mucilaginibacter sp.]|uniref:D-glycero-alpha-D-manno-heptose-1,7-bisphosphate 7-phosphatase n=1 Tax=Mucilaginibacter sp. TaxID=1882438 RepID=UPI00260731D5|nr:HAD family hydrolase [Mucilaginibacter sp.]MDB4920741.1 hydrolase, HAD-superfamily, subfamily [Mucilaginibacter sp.]